MADLSRYGTVFGSLLETPGRVFFLAPSAAYSFGGESYVASDGNSGLLPSEAMLTLNAVFDKVTADVGDRVILLPGSYTFTATQTLDVAGVQVVGCPGGPTNTHEHGTRTTRYSASITTSASAAVLTISAARTEVAYLHIVPASAQAGISLSADDANLHDLTWNMTTAANTATFGISIAGASTRPRMSNMYVYVTDNQGPFLRCASATGGLDGGVLQQSTIVLAGTTAWDDVVEITTGVDNFMIRDCDFMHSSGAIMTDVVDVTGNTNDHAVLVMRCMHAVAGDLTEATATSDIALCNNFIATIQGGTGGTLSTG